MLEVHLMFTIVPSEMRHLSEILNAHRLIVFIDSKFSNSHEVDRRQRALKRILEVTEVRIAIIL